MTVNQLENFTNDMFFIIPEEGPTNWIHSYRRSILGFNYFTGFVKTSEPMQDPNKYRSVRIVSNIIEFKSDTRPGGVFDISGQFNAVLLPFAPQNLQTLDHG